MSSTDKETFFFLGQTSCPFLFSRRKGGEGDVGMDDMRELMKQVMDVREWLVKLDTKLDHLQSVRETADEAHAIATKALALAEENARDITEVKVSNSRSWQVIVGMGSTFIVSILLYFLTK